ncbi:MAG TPA: hypothetical protein ENK57_12435 [Polyangiaceae bacterium]|nr:hypothetical protein [Polyangiaceae bacterium]
MSAEEVAEHIRSVDRLILKGKDVPAEDLVVNISALYDRYKWGGGGPTPLSESAIGLLGLEERTTDGRWMNHFDGHGSHVGVYRSVVGYYWLLRYDATTKSHTFEHVGAAADVNDKYGTT